MRWVVINNINGWIILDKQTGITSRQAVTKISRILNIKKIGHGGTLDPMATGVLPIAVGEATKCISFIQNKSKKYSFIVKWGETTNTDDSEGTVLEKSNVRPTKNQILEIINSFTGKIFQKPPIFSAIKIDGKRSYKLARNNIIVKHQPREVEIHKLILKNIINSDFAEFEVLCGKGTYVRSLAKDIAEKLNTKGHVTSLRRHTVGDFSEKDTIFIDFFKEIIHSPAILKKMLPIEAVLDDIPALALNEIEARKLKLGQKIQFNSLEFKNKFLNKHPNFQEFERLCAIRNDSLIALVKIETDLVKPKRIINIKIEGKYDVDRKE